MILIFTLRIWLLEARDLLNSRVPNQEHRIFHGFDISAAQFPGSPPEGVSFSCQDILKPFPPEHHGKYDLVHVRLLVTAFPEKEYETAVRNLVEILSTYLKFLLFTLLVMHMHALH